MPRSSSMKKIAGTQAKFNLNCLQFVAIICGVLLTISTQVDARVLKKRETPLTANATTTTTSIDPDPNARTPPGDFKSTKLTKLNESENITAMLSPSKSENLTAVVYSLDVKTPHGPVGNRITLNDELDMALSVSNSSIGVEQTPTPMTTTTTTEEILHELEEVAVKIPQTTTSKPLTASVPLRTLVGGRDVFDSDELGSGELEKDDVVIDGRAAKVIEEEDAMPEDGMKTSEGKSVQLVASTSTEFHQPQPADSHISNEIRNHSTEKRAKFIADNSTNAQQLNLPDVAEAWSLAGMKSVPSLNSSLGHTMERLVFGDSESTKSANTTATTPSTMLSDLPNTSNSEKNLLDWSQIMLMNSNNVETKRDTVASVDKMEPFENRTEILINSTLDSTDSDMDTLETATQAGANTVEEISSVDKGQDLPSVKPVEEIHVATQRPLLSVTLERQTPAEFLGNVGKENTTAGVILSLNGKDNGIIETTTATTTQPPTTGAISHDTPTAPNVTEALKNELNRDDEIQEKVSHLLSAPTTAEPHMGLQSTVGTWRNETLEATEPLRESFENEMRTSTTTTATTTMATTIEPASNINNNKTSENSELQKGEENNETNNEVVVVTESERIPTVTVSTPASKVLSTERTSTVAEPKIQKEPDVDRVTTTLTPYLTTTTTVVSTNFDSAATTTTASATQDTPTSSSTAQENTTTEIAEIDGHNIGKEFISSSTTASELLITSRTTHKPEIDESLGASTETTPFIGNALANGSATTPATTTTLPLTTTTSATTTEPATTITTTTLIPEIQAPAIKVKVNGTSTSETDTNTSVTNQLESSIETNVIDPADKEKTTLKPFQASTTATFVTTSTTTTTEGTALLGEAKANKPERPFKSVTEVEQKTLSKDSTGNTVDEEDNGGDDDDDYKNEEAESNKNVDGRRGETEGILIKTQETEKDKEDEEIAVTTEASSTSTTTTITTTANTATESSSSSTTEANTETTTTTTTMAAVLLEKTTTTATTMETITSTTQQPPLISLLDDTTTSTTTTTISPPTVSTAAATTTPGADRTSPGNEEMYSVFPTTTSTSTTTATPPPPPIDAEIITSTPLPSSSTTTTTTTALPETILHASIGGPATKTGSGLGMLPTNMPGMNTLDTTGTDGAASAAAGDGTDVNVIIAVSVGVIGVIAAILLVTFLYLIRKRQKQMSYGQRCRPVSLDAYSLDNVSVLGSVRRKGALRASKRSYGNAAFDDPSLRHNVLNASELTKFVEKRSQIFEEFRDVPQIIARADEVPAGCEDKNRYANVIPLPETRVTLQQLNDDEKTEYINANYVRGPKDSPNYYIACQAPMEITVADFWRMIWEQKSRVIVQATDLIENGIEKCAEYLPPSVTLDNHTTYGDFQVTLKNREVKDKYAISTIVLKNIVSEMSRELTHYWYKWPEVGVPSEEAPIIAMLLEVRTSLKTYAVEEASVLREQNSTLSLKSVDSNDKANGTTSPIGMTASSPSGEINGNVSAEKLKAAAKSQGPLTIHCSPGTGRTGTIIACDMAIRSLETPKRSVDIPQIVYYVRRGRASAVQTREQYEYIYKVANMYATKITNLSNEN